MIFGEIFGRGRSWCKNTIDCEAIWQWGSINVVCIVAHRISLQHAAVVLYWVMLRDSSSNLISTGMNM